MASSEILLKINLYKSVPLYFTPSMILKSCLCRNIYYWAMYCYRWDISRKHDRSRFLSPPRRVPTYLRPNGPIDCATSYDHVAFAKPVWQTSRAVRRQFRKRLQRSVHMIRVILKFFGVSFEVYGTVFINLFEVEEFSNDRFCLGFGSMYFSFSSEKKSFSLNRFLDRFIANGVSNNLF